MGLELGSWVIDLQRALAQTQIHRHLRRLANTDQHCGKIVLGASLEAFPLQFLAQPWQIILSQQNLAQLVIRNMTRYPIATKQKRSALVNFNSF